MAERVAAAHIDGVLSMAGRVLTPKAQALPMRSGGFGGAAGMAQFIRDAAITHVVDATHPFAAQISTNAVAACAMTQTPLVALDRPAWRAEAGDDWRHVPDIATAAAALSGPARRVFLAVGRMHLAAFAIHPQHRYLLRLVDPPEGALPLPRTDIVVARGPFQEDDDLALLRDHRIDLVVSKNSGGTGARAKLDAARRLGIAVIMIDRPQIAPRPVFATRAGIEDWLLDHGVNLGV